MDHYIDVKVLPDPEFDAATLMNALYAKLHRTLVATNEEKIGVSFPNAKKTPGNIMRLHAEQATLQQLMEKHWLKGLGDYTHVDEIKPVPAPVEYVQVKRIQLKMTAARLRRAVKRGSMSVDQAEALLAERKLLKKPFFQFQSSSTNQRFPLFIEYGKPQKQPTSGRFNSYGLSDIATVPWF